MRYEIRVLEKDEALGFLSNMRWFDGYGKISLKPVKEGPNKGLISVCATAAAWSNWVEDKQ